VEVACGEGERMKEAVLGLGEILGTSPGGVWQSLHVATVRWLDFT